MELTATIKHRGGDVVLTCQDQVQHEAHRSGKFYEHWMLDWIAANIPSGGTWVDAGANFGNHTLFFSRHAGQVVSIEPVRENVALLSRNVEANGITNVRIHEAALGSEPGTMGYDDPNGIRWSQVQMKDQGSHNVAVITLDSLNLQDVRLIKIDVEGMERSVLEGAIKTLWRDRPELFIEIWEGLEQFQELLAPMGYVLIERFNHAPTYHFSASGRYPVTYTKPAE